MVTPGSSFVSTMVDLAGGKVALAEAGAGGRPLLMIHGFSGAKEDFTPWLAELAAAGWHAVAYDNFGHGESAAPSGVEDYSLSVYTDQLFGVMDELGWQTCVAVGHSMGGMILEEALERDVRRFSAVVLMDTSHGAVQVPEAYAAMVRELVTTVGVRGLLDAGNAVGAFEGAPSSRAVYERDPGYREFNERKFLATAAPVFLAMLDELGSRPDRLETLKTLTIPALVIVGEQDAAFVDESKEMAVAIPGADFALIASAAHCPQFEAPEAWWAALSSFLSSRCQGA